MANDEHVREYIRQAEEAEAWAKATMEPLLKVRWQKLAKEYRELAQSRLTLLSVQGLGEPLPTVMITKRDRLN